MDNRKIRVAITHGDTNGIGYELIFKTFAEPQMLELCTPIVYGSPKVAAYHRKALNMPANFSIINDASEACDGRVNMLACFDDEVKVELGVPTQESGAAAVKALDRAMTDFRKGCFDVLVSCPVDDNNMQDGHIKFGGLTEYVETSIGNDAKAVNMLVGECLRMASVTNGLQIKNVSSKITKESLSDIIKVMSESLRRDFRLSNPRIAVIALNPDAAGEEEKTQIIPAIDELSENGVLVFGPYQAKTFFGMARYDAFDGVVTMYDDQCNIPFDTISCGYGFNHIAGLPLVCTSPTTTAGFDIAGQGKADENMLRHAIYAAIDIFRNRTNYDIPLANPLKKLYHEKRDESDKARFTVQPKRHDNAPREKVKQHEE